MTPLDRYAALIRECLGPQTSRPVDSPRPVDRVVAAYHEGRTEGIKTAIPLFKGDGPLLPQHGDFIARVAWECAALYDQDPQARGVLARIVDAQRPDGAYFTSGIRVSPETTWYWELVVLHAVATAGIRAGVPPLLDSACRAALYHLHETQPDHATTEPWGLNAFLLSPDTYPLADQLLHTVRVQHPSGATGISAILLADTLRTLPVER